MTSKQYDFVILGSGTSGAVAAYFLQKNGAQCLMLEAGHHYKTEDFPLCEADYSANLFWGGGLEFDTAARMAFLRGKCVGGGSVINGALMDRFDDVAFSDWRAAGGVSFFTEEAMARHYEVAESQIALQTIPEHHRNRNAQLFVQAMEKHGYVWHPLRRCQSDCATEQGNDCIVCLGGCHRGSKQSTLVTYIPRAQSLGMDLISDVMAERIEHSSDGVTVYALRNGATETFRARHAILACGALGTTHLLLRSGFEKKLPALGKHFAMHPQQMVIGIFEEPVDAFRGPLQGVKSLDPGFRKRGFKLENVFAPPISIALVSGKTGSDLIDFMRRYRYFACIEVAVRDENAGSMAVDGQGRLRIHKPLTDQDRKRMDDGLNTVEEMYRSVGAREVVRCPMPFGLHLMGGCVMGTDGATSVVNPEFQVHDHPHFYCADSSIFPNAPGINPALTIMALAHRMAETITGTTLS